jgi:hypothetical protein
MKTTCKRCEIEFTIRPSILKPTGNYCSHKCQYEPRVTVACKKCGKGFNIKLSVLKKGHGDFCSRACVNLERRPRKCKSCGREFIAQIGRSGEALRLNCSPACSGNLAVSKADLIADLRKIATEIGHRPTYSEYKKLGRYGCGVICKHGGLKAIWESMGMVFKVDNGIKSVKVDSLIADLQRLRKEIGKLPTVADVESQGKHSIQSYRKKLEVNHWYEVLIKVFPMSALEIAKITPPNKRTYEMWLNLLKGLHAELKRLPTRVEAGRRISFRQNVYPVLSGRSFQSVLEDAGFDASNTTSSRLVSDEEIVNDIVAVARKTGRLPHMREYDKKGKFSKNMVARRFGSWRKAKELVAPQLNFQAQPVKYLSHVPDASRDRLKESSVDAIRDFFQGK